MKERITIPTAKEDCKVRPNIPLLEDPTSSLPATSVLKFIPGLVLVHLPRTNMARMLPAQKNPTQNLAIT